MTSPSLPPAHIPVMPEQVMTLLAPAPGETAVDLTLGLGGHALLLSQAVGSEGAVVGFDLDEANLQAAETRLREGPARFVPIHARFTEVAERLRSLPVPRLSAPGVSPSNARSSQSGDSRLGEPGYLRADVVLADLGFSSSQMDDPARGFSFAVEGPLDMRMDRSQRLTAADLVARLSERELADVIYRYGEDPFARRIARKLAQKRECEPIRSTARLAELVVEAYGPRARASRLHPATRTFMALRIAVNDELGSLRTLLESIARSAEEIECGEENSSWLARGARLAIISFHSLEDRMVKHAFAELCKRNLATRLTRKPLTPDDNEVRANPRARSAKLRAIRIGGSA